MVAQRAPFRGEPAPGAENEPRGFNASLLFGCKSSANIEPSTTVKTIMVLFDMIFDIRDRRTGTPSTGLFASVRTSCLSVLLGFCLALPWAGHAQSLHAQGITMDLHLSGHPGDPTVVYFPGCNGLDEFGRKYQEFHLQRIRAAWGNRVNVVRVQAINDVTQGRPNGLCFWTAAEMDQAGVSTYPFA